MTDKACKHAKPMFNPHYGAELSAKPAVAVSTAAAYGSTLAVQCIAAGTAASMILHMP